jgi:hypothetical protein
MNVNAVLYKPLGLGVSVLGGLAANAVFRKIWSATAGTDKKPEATDPRQTWQTVLIGAATQGAVFGLVKAAIDRGGAAGYRKLTGHWPDDRAEDNTKAG